jgi:hypothetical protein
MKSCTLLNPTKYKTGKMLNTRTLNPGLTIIREIIYKKSTNSWINPIGSMKKINKLILS